MIDTIVFVLTKDMFQITDPDKFEPAAHWVENLSKQMRGMQSKQNPSKKELLKGIYKPRLSIANLITKKSFNETMLRIELSLPKLLFGNNFNEIQNKDFAEVTTKLKNTLKDMGVLINSDISKLKINAVHYCKNIALNDGSTPYHFINKIKEANIKLSLDTNQTDYRNDGHSYKWHCNRYEVVFYDKIRDLEKAKQSSKRSLEKDSDLQLNIFNKINKRSKLEILRMEVRLNKRDKMKQLFKKLKIKSNLTFKSLFKPAISKKILLHYLDELERKRPKLIDYKAANDKALFTDLIFNNPYLGPKQILQMYGLKKIFEVVNARELRVMFGAYSERSWYRLISEANKINLPAASQDYFGIIRTCMIKFRPLDLNKFI
jgi:hypothetical protein